MPGDWWQKFANLRLLYSYMWTHPGKKLVFMGGEWGQWHEWDCDGDLQWDLLRLPTHQGVQKCLADLNHLLQTERSLHELDFHGRGFEWIDCHDHLQSTLAYLRRAKDPQDFTVVGCNFTPVPLRKHRIGVPDAGWYAEIFNSDSAYYGGTNIGNFPGCQAEPTECHGRPFSIQVSLPPLAAVILKPQQA
jgi:1,4-alpha-glucan branching enzyme